MGRVAKLRNVWLVGSMFGAFGCAEVAGPAAGDGDDAVTVAPVVADNGDLRVAAPLGQTATVGVRSRSFADMDELFQFALDEMGGEPVYDEAAQLVGVRGVSVTSGDVRFVDEDTGEAFAARDLAQAYLGGAAGTIEVAGKTLEVNAPQGEVRSVSAALSEDTEGCVGDDCISGHSWKTNYVVYRSIGSETKQSRGGYSNRTYTCCASGGTLVTYQGRQQCRYVNEWEPADPENGIYKPIPVGYGYRATQTCSYSTTSNRLSLSVTALAPSGWPAATAERTENDSREITMSAWGVGIGVTFLGIDDVAGICGYHSGSRGSATRSGAGIANDTRCPAAGLGGGFFSAQP